MHQPAGNDSISANDTLDQEIEDASLGSNPIDLEIAKAEKELYLESHDFTGALKRKYLSHDLSSEYKDRFENGNFETIPEDTLHASFLIDVGNLDQVNDSGGHAAGDMVLLNTATEIEKFLANNSVPKGSYQIYRFNGTSFFVSLKRPNDSSPLFDDFSKNIQSSQIRATDNDNPVPIGCSYITRAEMVKVISSEYGDNNDPKVRQYIGILTEALEAKSKISLLKETYKSLKSLYEIDPKAAEIQYQKYNSKLYSNTYSDLKALLAVDLSTIELNAIKQMIDKTNSVPKNVLANSIIKEDVLNRSSSEYVASQPEINLEKVEATNKIDPKVYQEYSANTKNQRSILKLGEELESLRLMDADPKIIKLKELELRLLQAKTDELTGLYERSEYYKVLEAKIADNEDVYSIFIDLSYLKYLSKEGGRELGDYALKSTASLLEQAVLETGIDAEVFRYAGDEFTIITNSDKADVTILLDKIEELKNLKEPIAPTYNSSANYVPMPPTFNYGLSSTTDAEAIYNSMEENNLVETKYLKDTPGYFNFIADIQTRAADLSVEIQKIHSRFRTFTKLVDDFGVEDPRLKLLHAYSTKSLLNIPLERIKDISDRLKELDESDRSDSIMTYVIRNLILNLERENKSISPKILEERKSAYHLVLRNLNDRTGSRSINTILDGYNKKLLQIRNSNQQIDPDVYNLKFI